MYSVAKIYCATYYLGADPGLPRRYLLGTQKRPLRGRFCFKISIFYLLVTLITLSVESFFSNFPQHGDEDIQGSVPSFSYSLLA